MPSIAGFTTWLTAVMGLSTAAMASAAPVIPIAYNVALAVVNTDLCAAPNPSGVDDYSIYSLAVYNLGGDRLVNYVQDIPPDTTFADARLKYNVTNFLAGVVQASSDDGTGQTLTVPEAFQNLTIMDLNNIATPWGRQYLAFAQDTGTLWGIS